MKFALSIAVSNLVFCIPAIAQQLRQNIRLQIISGQEPSMTAQENAAPRPLSLAEVVNLALEHSPQLALARVRYNVAKSTAGVAHSDFLPNLYTGSGAAYTNGFPGTPGGQAPAVFEMSYTQALFDPQKRGEYKYDEDIAKNQELEYQNARESTIVNAASAYLELATVQRSLELLQEERDSSQKILDLARQREAAGLELPVIVTQDELQVAEIAQRIVQNQDREEVLTEQICDMTGLPAGQPIQASFTEIPVSESAEPASNVVAETVAHSISIREAENYRLARQQLLKGARESYWPTIGIIGEYSVLSKFNNYQEFFAKFQRNNVNVGVQITIPIFAAKTSANVALAKSNLDEATLELTEQKRGVQRGAEQKVRTLKEDNAAKQVAQLDLQLAQQQLQDGQAKFNQGHLTLGELEQLRVVENEKWLAFLDADLARERAELDLLQATGQLAEVLH